MTAGALLAVLAAASASGAVPDLPVAERCAVVDAVLGAKAKMPVSGMRTVDVRFPDIAGVRNRAYVDNLPVVKADWHVRTDYPPMFVPSSPPRPTCGSSTFALLQDGPEDKHGTRELVLLVTITPVANQPARFAFEEKLGRNPRFRFDSGVAGVAIPPLGYSGLVEKAASGSWTAVVREARFAE